MSELATTSPFDQVPTAAASALGEDFVDFLINENDNNNNMGGEANPLFHQLINASIHYQPEDSPDMSNQRLLLENQFSWSTTHNAQQMEDIPPSQPTPVQTRKKRRISEQRQTRRRLFPEDNMVEGVRPLCLLPKMDASKTALHIKSLSFYGDEAYVLVTDDSLRYGNHAPSTNHRIYLPGGVNLCMVYNHAAYKPQSVWLNRSGGAGSNILLSPEMAITFCEWVMELESMEPGTDISCTIGKLSVKFGNKCITVATQGNRKNTVYIPITSSDSLVKAQKSLETFKLGSALLDLRSKLKNDLRAFVQTEEFERCGCSHGGREHIYAFHFSQDISKHLPIRWVHGEIAPSDTLPFWG